MTLRERIEGDFIRESKAKNASAVSTLRMLRAALKNAEIDAMKPLGEPEVTSVIQREVKKMRDALESYEQGKREDLAGQARAEVVLLEGYLPAQMPDEELQAIVAKTIAEAGAVTEKDFGKIMGTTMKAVQGRADAGKVSAAIKALLGK